MIDNSVPSHSARCEGCGRYHGSVNVLLACLVRHLREARECAACNGDGFVHQACGCREAFCPHVSIRPDPTDERPGLYQKFWVRRSDGSSCVGQKHHDCDYLVLDWVHDPFAIAAARAYASACEAAHPDLAMDIRQRADAAERALEARR